MTAADAALTAARSAAVAARNTWRAGGPAGDAYALKATGGWGVVSIDSAIRAGLINTRGDSLLGDTATAEIVIRAGVPVVEVRPL